MNLAEHPMLRTEWYYSIEVAPGLITPGKPFLSMGLVRCLLARMPVEGQRCLDIGAMEGMMSILMERRAAQHVTCWDRSVNQSHGRVQFLREQLGVQLDFVYTDHFAQLREALPRAQFDIVILAGVLYHVVDPFATLLRARSLLRHGGLMLVETAGVLDDTAFAAFNSHGRFYPNPVDANYWFLSVAGLDALCRCARLEPLDFLWLQDPASIPRRMACVCRATEGVPGLDPWLCGQALDGNVRENYAEFIDWTRCHTDRAPLPYDHPLVAMSSLAPPLTPDDLRDQMCLRLGDTT